jgi:hypothetical protein
MNRLSIGLGGLCFSITLPLNINSACLGIAVSVVSKAQPLASTPEILALDQSPLSGFCGFILVALVVADST